MQQAACRTTTAVAPRAAFLSGSLAAGLARAPAAALAALAAWQRRAEERQRLTQLSDHQLHDMGLSRAAVEAMARKPFWVR